MKPFVFTRLQYTSGDWDTDQRMPSNILHSLVEYTTLPVEEQEKTVKLGSHEIFKSPFCYLSGHKLVEFSGVERESFKQYVSNGGFVFVDDCNHDIDGLFAKSFEQEMERTFGSKALQKIPGFHTDVLAANFMKGIKFFFQQDHRMTTLLQLDRQSQAGEAATYNGYII